LAAFQFTKVELITTSQIQGYDATVTTIQQDKFGNRLKITDLSSGTLEETYNAFGELVSSKNQKQTDLTKTIFTYDKLGRIKTRIEDGQLTSWTYDNKPFGIGKPDKLSNNDNTIEFFYDNLGRIRQKDETISGEISVTGNNVVFSYKYNYDAFSRPREQTFPSGIVIRSHYNINGYLYKITEDDRCITKLWETSMLNAKDQLIQTTMGNCITTHYEYQPETSNLSAIHSFSSDNDLQDLEYQWDNIGNLLGRKKWNDPSHSSFLDETFQYDNLNRLTSVSLNNQITSNFNYDDLGNLTEKSPLTNMSYGAQNSGPYAITEANFTDNEISDITQDITYTIFDKISTISEGTSSLAVTYGIDHERIKQIIQTNGEANSTKVYLGGSCEKITDDQGSRFINFIRGPKGLFAIIVKNTTGHTDIYYILKDHLGSINCITDKSGYLLEELSFDPWGRRRNSTTWTYDNTPTKYIFDRGFTGHEHLDLFGLINMNGRAFDPIVGRFLSTDAFVQSPDFTQNFNRYSYCVNNPLKYTDPSGDFFIGTIVTIIIDFFRTGITEGGFEFWNWGKSNFNKAWETFDPTASWSRSNKAFKIDLGAFQTDSKKTFAGQGFELLSRFTWEAPQYTLGNIYSHVRNMSGNVDDVSYFRGATVVNFNTNNNSNGGITSWGLTLAPYINTQNVESDVSDRMLRHEYGHIIQSRYTGPMFVPKIGIPSLLSSWIDGENHNHDHTWFEVEANQMALSYFNNHDYGLGWDDINYPRNYSVLDWWALLFNPLFW